MKFYFTRGCYPEVYVKMVNYLGTPTNYMYSYHCPDVLQGILTSLVFLSEKPMKQRLKMILRALSYCVKHIVFRRERHSADDPYF